MFGILSNCLNQWVLSTSYTFNKAYISSVLCTKKDKPELHCEGKCFMSIKLKELAQKNKHDQANLKSIIETVAPSNASLLHSFYEITLTKVLAQYMEQKPVYKPISIFHPPKNT